MAPFSAASLLALRRKHRLPLVLELPKGRCRGNRGPAWQRLRVLATGCLLKVQFQGLNCPSRIRAVGADVALVSFCSQCRSRTDQSIHWGATRQTEINTPGPIVVGGESSGAASPRSEIAVMTTRLSYTMINRSIHNRPPVA